MGWHCASYLHHASESQSAHQPNHELLIRWTTCALCLLSKPELPRPASPATDKCRRGAGCCGVIFPVTLSLRTVTCSAAAQRPVWLCLCGMLGVGAAVGQGEARRGPPGCICPVTLSLRTVTCGAAVQHPVRLCSYGLVGVGAGSRAGSSKERAAWLHLSCDIVPQDRHIHSQSQLGQHWRCVCRVGNSKCNTRFHAWYAWTQSLQPARRCLLLTPRTATHVCRWP
jgi:hypothetical protein